MERSKPNSVPLTLGLSASTGWSLLLISAYAGGAAGLACSSHWMLLTWLPALALIWPAWRDLQQHGLRRHARSIIGLRCEADGERWHLLRGDGALIPAENAGIRLCHALIVILEFRSASQGRITVVVTRDATTPPEFRRLRLFLRQK